MTPIRPRERRLILGTFLVGVSLFLYVYFVEPRILWWLSLEEQIQAVEAELSEMKTLWTHREEIEAQSQRWQKQMVSIRGEEEEMRGFFAEVERVANDARLQSISLRPRTVRTTRFYRLQGLEVTVDGSQRGLAKFLYSLRESPQLIRVDSLQVTALAEKGKVRGELVILKTINQR